MTEAYSIESVGGITTIRFSKAPSTEIMQKAVDDVANNSPTARRLWDLTCGGFTQSTDQVKELAVYGKSKSFPPSKVAIIAPEDVAFGLSRIFEVYREDDVSEHMIFRTEQEARAWLTLSHISKIAD